MTFIIRKKFIEKETLIEANFSHSYLTVKWFPNFFSLYIQGFFFVNVKLQKTESTTKLLFP